METPDRPFALLVEDEPLFRMDAEALLEEAGYAVLEAVDTAGAMRHLEGGGPIRLLLADIRLGGGDDGLVLARQVAERWPHIAIVVMSAAVTAEQADAPAGAAFLAKPFTPSRLAAAMARARPPGRT